MGAVERRRRVSQGIRETVGAAAGGSVKGHTGVLRVSPMGKIDGGGPESGAHGDSLRELSTESAQALDATGAWEGELRMGPTFRLPDYHPPNFAAPPLRDAPLVQCEPAPEDGVLPDNFHATSNLPEYVQVQKGEWVLCPESRMDAAIVVDGRVVRVVEPRDIRKGDPVVVGRSEDGETGVYVHVDGFDAEVGPSGKFEFNVRRTRESPFSHDYDSLYELLRYERGSRGWIVWVLGPAIAFDKDSREAMVALINHGYSHAILAGNALATHDLEAALYGTALGQDIYHQRLHPLGHYHHLDVLNRARRFASTDAFVRSAGVSEGIVAACIAKGIPLVLAGSIRDDGPLPGVTADVYRSQHEMRAHARRATTVIAVATQLHAIAFGNMLPSYQVSPAGVRPVYFYIVDVSEFAVDKLTNRGSAQVRSITTNAQDFMVNLRRSLIPSNP